MLARLGWLEDSATDDETVERALTKILDDTSKDFD